MESHDFFRYTSGRWLYNESLRLSERYLPFNVNELKRVIAQSVGNNEREIVHFKKLAEGGFNRVFLASMSDNSQLIARVPYPSTIPKRFTIASEVATMDFLRCHGIPVPKVRDYSTVSDNAIGTEYIIMDTAEGRQIGDYWFSMNEAEKLKIIFEIAELEGKLFSMQLPASGSIYYMKDLDADINRVELPDPCGTGRFCVGPATSQNLWYRERALLDVFRGPFIKAEDSFKVGALKELAYLRKYGRDQHIRQRLLREVVDYQKQPPKTYLRCLEDFLCIANQICPGGQSFLSRPIIRHPDLNPNNIFVSDSFKITNLIDWQHCMILPMFLQCGIPEYLQNYGDDISESLVKPELPVNLDQLDQNQQTAALERHRKRFSHFYYVAATVKYNNDHFDALWEDRMMLRQRLFAHSSSPWEGDNITLKVDLIEAIQNWSKIAVATTDGATLPCPVSYPQAEVDKFRSLYEKMQEMANQLRESMDCLGIGDEGWVPNDQLRLSKSREVEMKERALEFTESDFERQMLKRHWPFDNQDEQE